MGKLLQVAGFPCETAAIQLVELLKKIFPDEKLQNVWLDPYNQQRAVAMFLHELDETRLNQLIQQLGVKFHDHILTFNTVKPTSSILVRTYGALLYGTIDKLWITFKKRPTRTVQHIHPLDDDCYEITFSEGWDAVQEVCKKDWPIGKTKLTVCPYFECFKKPFVEIHEKLSITELAERFQNICTKLSTPMNLTTSPSVKLSNKPNVKLSENIVQETLLEATKDSDYRRSSDSKEKIIVYFKHQSIPILLRCLHFDKALDGYDCHLNIHEDEDSGELEFEISGTKMKVKKVSRLLDQEYKKVKSFKTRNNFLALKKILPDLQKGIDATGSVVVITEMGNDLILYVTDSRSNKVPFQDFVSSLVLEEELTELPLEDYQQHSRWFDEFNGAYEYGHIFVSDSNVKIMFLSHTKQKMNVMVKLMKSKIKLTSINEAKVKDKDCSTSDHQNLTELSDSGNARKQEHLGDMTSCSEDEQIINEVYCFNTSFVLWLLHTLNLRSTVAEICPTLTLELDVLGLKVFISGQAKEVQTVKKFLKEEDEMISLTDDEETFLEREKIKSQLLPLINKHGLSLVPDSKDPTQLKLVVINNHGQFISLKNLALDFVVIKKCPSLPSVRFQDKLQWRELVESLHSKHPFHKISVDGTKVKILTLIDRDEMETNEIEKVLIQFIINNDDKSLKKNIPLKLAVKQDSSFENEQYNTTFYRKTGHSQQNDGYGKSYNKSKDSNFIDFLPFNQQQIQYCNMFLQQELQDIQETYKSTEITIQSNGIELKASSEHCGYELKARMKSLFDKIINVTKELQYPGLVSFFMSEYGLKLISQMSTKYEFYIEPPIEGANKTNTGLEVLNPGDERINYQVTLLGTAKCPGFTVHLVQGNMRDMKSDIKVEFCICSTAQECIFKTNKSSRDVTVILPRWKAPEMSECQEHFDQLRNSFSSTLCIVLDQVKYLKSTTVTFDTSAIRDEEFPFPLDVIAKIITEQLFAAFTDYCDSSIDVDVYICEPKCESVFKEFSYFMKRMGVDFGMPDQVSWDQICERDVFKYPDYRQYKYDVEIVSNCPENLEFRNLFCYPIQPSLEASSCPVYNDPMSSKSLLEHSLKELLRDLPDGLLIGDVHPVSCFPFSRDALVYCIPQWGSGIYQALKASLTNIFKQSYTYDAIIITLPGLGFQKFPLPYLVQTYFQLLDEIIAKENSVKKKTIYLVVHNTDYKMAFERELHKRCPKFAEKQLSWRPFSSFWDSADKKEPKGRASSPCTNSSIVVSKVESLPIKYWGKSREKINMAHCDIERELNRLMSDSTLTCRLDQKETGYFERLSKQMANISVLVTFKKQFAAQNQGQHHTKSGNKGKGKKKILKTDETGSKIIMTGSQLTFQGLIQSDVYDFRDVINSAIGKDSYLESCSRRLSEEIVWPSGDEDKY